MTQREIYFILNNIPDFSYELCDHLTQPTSYPLTCLGTGIKGNPSGGPTGTICPYSSFIYLPDP
jgi:hypothetical protein